MNEKDKERLARAIGEIDDDLIRDAQMPTAKGRGYGR